MSLYVFADISWKTLRTSVSELIQGQHVETPCTQHQPTLTEHVPLDDNVRQYEPGFCAGVPESMSTPTSILAPSMLLWNSIEVILKVWRQRPAFPIEKSSDKHAQTHHNNNIEAHKLRVVVNTKTKLHKCYYLDANLQDMMRVLWPAAQITSLAEMRRLWLSGLLGSC